MLEKKRVRVRDRRRKGKKKKKYRWGGGQKISIDYPKIRIDDDRKKKLSETEIRDTGNVRTKERNVKKEGSIMILIYTYI